MASAQAFRTYWMLRLLVKPQIARRWGSQQAVETSLAQCRDLSLRLTGEPCPDIPREQER